MRAYYNEIDPRAAQWLRELIGQGLIPGGDVDERSIEDVRPDELVPYVQCHFFAGIGGWPLALRVAGIADDEPLWTGSCPCQPLSAAGARKGFADERHLWPDWFWLIEQRRPVRILGEQVASPLGLQWLDLVSADLEGAGYAAGAADLCAAGQCVEFEQSAEGQQTLKFIRGAVQHCPDPILAAELRDFAEYAGREIGYGAAHIRQRLYWTGRLADVARGGRRIIGDEVGPGRRGHIDGGGDASRGMALADGGDSRAARLQRSREHRQQPEDGSAGAMAHAADADGRAGVGGAQEGTRQNGSGGGRPASARASGSVGDAGSQRLSPCERPDPSGAGRRDEGRATEQPDRPPLAGCDWIICTDGKARPTEPGLQPLAHGLPGRVGQLRGYGNAIHIETAANFIKAVFDEERGVTS